MAISPDPLLRIPILYHFTPSSNLAKIRQHDGLLATKHLRNLGEEFCPGGDDDSLALDARCGMDAYVHLCFQRRHPMAHRVTERKPDANLLYLQIDRTILNQPEVLFSTGVGYASGVRTVTLQEACEQNLIDFPILYQWFDWRVPEINHRRQAAELCEVLVPDYVPMSFIRNFPNG